MWQLQRHPQSNFRSNIFSELITSSEYIKLRTNQIWTFWDPLSKVGGVGDNLDMTHVKLSLTRRYLDSRAPKMRVMVSSLNGVMPITTKWRRKRGETTLRPPPGGAIAHRKCVSCSTTFVVSFRSYLQQFPREFTYIQMTDVGLQHQRRCSEII